MTAAEIRALGTDEIQAKIDETHKALFNLRFQAASGQLEDFNRVTALRRDLARLKTILRERELAAQAQAGEPAASR
jgi:large subunit ribosomal protein L29